MMRKLKTDSKVQKILLSFLIAAMMNPIWNVIIFIIDTSKTTSNEMFSTSILERTTIVYTYFWSNVFLLDNRPDPRTEILLALFCNTFLYFTLSYISLSLFGSDKINGKKIMSLLIGVSMNPVLIVILYNIDWHIRTNYIFSITLLERTLFAYMFNWSVVLLPGQPLNIKAEMLLVLICNTILYFSLSYGLLSLLSRLTSRANKLS